MVINWLDHFLFAGIASFCSLITRADEWKIVVFGLQLLSAVFLSTITIYIAACALKTNTGKWIGRDINIKLPKMGIAVAQVAVSASSWFFIVVRLCVLLNYRIVLKIVMDIVLLCGLVDSIENIPVKDGVMKAVFAALTSHGVQQSDLLPALLSHHFIYFFMPPEMVPINYLIY